MQKLSANQFKILKKQKRENRFLLFLDNVKIIKDALAGGLKPKLILIENEERNPFPSYNCMIAEKKEIESLSDSKTPQGVICITEYIPHIVKPPKTNFLVLDGLQDPGNVGTLIRTAAACGFDYIYLLDCVHITNSKVIRSSVGTVLSCNIFEMTKQNFMNKNKVWNLFLLKADMNGDNVFKCEFNDLVGVVIGNEGQGVSKEISTICKKTVSIPMKKGVESLNASVSGALIMYQIAKNLL